MRPALDVDHPNTGWPDSAGSSHRVVASGSVSVANVSLRATTAPDLSRVSSSSSRALRSR